MITSRVLSLITLFTAVASFATSHQTHERLHQRASNTTLEDYEYVIVGSGPGGSPLAARLALAGYKVLLIDAGDDHGDDTILRVPALHPFASEYEPITWDFFVQHYEDLEQQKKDSKMTYEMPDGSYYVGLDPPDGATPLGISYPRTGTLGGCAEHNALIMIYPHETDWQYIQNITGDDTWSPDNMRTYYEKMENCHYLPNSIVGHGFDGWMPTTVTNPELIVQDQKVLSLVLAAATTMGQNWGLLGKLITTVTGLAEVLLNDINNPSPERDNTEAFYQVPLSMNFPEYSRASPRDWVLSVANAKNADGSRKYHLDLQLNTLVTKVTFNTTGSTPKATGVEFLVGQSLYRADPRSNASSTNGTPGSVRATREVIISGGTFNTPQILKLSGVGPAEELNKFGIPVVKDLPGVGTNLQDRYEVGVVGKSTSNFSLLNDCTYLQGDDPCLTQWEDVPLLKGGYSTNGIALAYPKHSSVAEDVPDLYLGGVPAYFKGYFPKYAEFATADKSIWTWLTLKAHSRNNAGTVQLKSTNPRDTPVITFNSFNGVDGDADLQAVYEGMRFGMEAFENLIPLDGGFERVWPTPNITSEADLKEFARNEAWGHHASCTCPIGADDDVMAVLDTDFRVRGVDNLRVVDASVFPKIPGFYVVLPIYMISEKAADVIIAAASA
ncbi:related to glucose dehydrogenase [Phialocephala subalpina]|uniref:Related to glucose dehydrogenase n=1 Tax=Phialocephala subalpina TaxID=576137 RepID=A0A1L7WPL8_9HELO|nr:related to glucose dehydrogenase [Phialocephala subalpina]